MRTTIRTISHGRKPTTISCRHSQKLISGSDACTYDHDHVQKNNQVARRATSISRRPPSLGPWHHNKPRAKTRRIGTTKNMLLMTSKDTRAVVKLIRSDFKDKTYARRNIHGRHISLKERAETKAEYLAKWQCAKEIKTANTRNLQRDSSNMN